MGSVAIRHRADLAAVVGSLAAITAVAWVLTVRLAASMGTTAGPMGMADAMPSPGGRMLLVFAMWVAMMVGMMVPSATPMVAAYTDWARRDRSGGSRPIAVASFLSGYVIVWFGFALAAAGLQLGLERAALLNAMGAAGTPLLGGTVLVLAGVFQVTPWKESCLGRCRTPLGFLIAEWRDGARGAMVMGTRHGAYCLGCCWALMGVLFVVGTMHLMWMAVIAGFVLVEKVAPRTLRLRYAAAAALVGWGVVTLVTAA